jgi:hypothetical protein
VPIVPRGKPSARNEAPFYSKEHDAQAHPTEPAEQPTSVQLPLPDRFRVAAPLQVTTQSPEQAMSQPPRAGTLGATRPRARRGALQAAFRVRAGVCISVGRRAAARAVGAPIGGGNGAGRVAGSVGTSAVDRANVVEGQGLSTAGNENDSEYAPHKCRIPPSAGSERTPRTRAGNVLIRPR